MARYDVTNGQTSTGKILNTDSMYVSMGGTADNTTVNANGMLYVSNGGTADKTSVNGNNTYYGVLIVSNGGTATNTTLNSRGGLYVSNGGSATNTTVNSWGHLEIKKGGTATKTTVNSGGFMYVYIGATATEIEAVDGAYLDFAVAPGTYIKGTSAGSAFEINNGVANNFTLNHDTLDLHAGATANNTTVNEWGHLFVDYGGTATNTTVNGKNGSIVVYAGGTADHTTVNDDGYMIVFNGGTADKTTVNENGDLCVSSGGTATNTTVNDGGDLWVESGGTATKTTVNPGGYMQVYIGGSATEIEAVDGAYLAFYVAPDTYAKGTSAGSAFEIKNCVANNFMLNSGCLTLTAGGTADNTTVNGKYSDLRVGSDGTATNTTVNNGGLIVSSGGKADNTTVNENGRLYVSNGGKADNTTVNEGGDLYVYGGGTATNTTVNSDGYIRVSSGGTATNTTVNYWGYFDVLNGGTADNTTVNSSGCLEVSSGGTATNTKVNYWGYLYLQSGGTATEIEAVDDAYLLFAVAPDTYAKGTSAGSAFEIKNGVATNFTLTCGELLLSSGGTASKTTLSSHGYIRVSSGGKADNTTVNAGGSMWVFSGGTADNTTVNENGHLYVYGGGKANSTTVKSGGKLDLFEDGVLTGRMTFSAGAVVSAYEGGGIIDFDLTHTTPSEGALVNDLSIVQGTPMYTLTVNGAQSIGAYKLADGASGFGSKTEITVRNPVGTDLGVLTVDSKSNTFSYGGKTYTLQLNDASLVVIVNSESGSPNIVTGDVNGHTVITEGSSALGVNVNGGGMLEIQPGGKGNNIMVSNGGLLLTQDAQVKGVTVDKGGAAYLGSDTVMASLVLNGGEAHVESDGWAFQMSKGKTVSSNTIVKNDGMLYISAGGHVEGLLASGGGRVIVESDGSLEVAKFAGATLDALNGANVSSAILLEGGRMNVFAGGSAQGVTISEGGILAVESGGEVNHINVSAGGVLTGVVKNGTTIRMYGGTLDFDISGFTPDSAPAYLYEDMDIASDEAYPCTLTVGDAQAYGTYGLMSYAYEFGCTVTVQDTSGKELGTLAAGSTVNIDGVDYTLNIGGSPAYPLTVTIADNEAPTIMNITADITAPTTSDVTLTAEFSDNVALASKQYRIGDGGAWTDYTTGVVVTGNATVYFKAVDTAGNETTDQYAVTNIDREKPEVLNVTPDNAEFTNQNVTVTAEFTDNMEVATKQYRIGDGAWTDYTTGVVVDKNTTVYFKAVDTAGNESDVAEYTVANIDKIPPTITITPSTTESGAESVTLSAVCKDETSMSSILQYRIGDGAWQDCTADVVVTENTTVSFKTYDTAGNETIESYVVSNIETVVPDTTKPTVSNVKANITTLTNQNVTVTAEFADDVALASSLYKIGDGAWTAYPAGGVVVTANATVYFKAVDTSGNESDVASLKIDNIDKTPPAKPAASASTTKPTNGSVNVTATFANDSVKNEYSLDGTNWALYPGAVKFDDNGTVHFRATDEAGNVSEVASYQVTNIDRIPPAKPTASADVTEQTEGSVKVTVNYSQDSAKKEYSWDGLVWESYIAPIVFYANGRVYFRAADAAGNMSEVNSYTVSNIEVVEPVNAPDDGWNDYLYDKKYGWNTDAHIAGFQSNEISSNGEIYLDALGTIDFEGMHNMFGNDGRHTDTGDVGRIVATPYAAKVSFTVKSTAAGTFYIYQEGTDKKGNRKQITLGKVTVKANQTATLKNICLSTEGKYYAAMTAKNVKNAGTTGVYNVNVVDGIYFRDADDGWNNMATNKPVVENPYWIGRGVETVLLDEGPMLDGGDYLNFVGFSDTIDYAKLELASTTYLSFDVATNGYAKFTLWKRDTKTGKFKSVTSATLKSKNGAQVSKLTKAQLLEVNDKYDYFVSMECKDAGKGGSAYYNVDINTVSTRFFDSADGGENNWLYDKKQKIYNDDANLRSNTISGSGDKEIYLDNNLIFDTSFSNYVGYQDAADYGKIVLTERGSVSFKITALADVTFEIWQKTQDKKGNPTVTSLQKKTTVKVKDYSVGASATTEALMLDAGEYYVSVTAKSTKATNKGSAFYSVTATALFVAPASALDMPESSGGLAMTDDLGFRQYDADMLAGSYLDTASDKLFGESNGGLLASL